MLLKTALEAKKQVQKDKKAGFRIGLVPTMGALHQGHISLVQASKEQCDRTYVSIFVNPAQFNDKKDLDAYPVDLESDLKLLEAHGVDAVFIPTVEDIYPEDHPFPKIDLNGLDKILEGEMRPGHFDGVAKVVYRFFEIMTPDVAFFGQKDFQQTVVIRHMTDLFNLPTEIVICPTLREPSGLAMSSRNIRLSEYDRSRAGFLYKTLLKLKEDINYIALEEAVGKAKNYLRNLPGVKIEYFAPVNGRNMEIVHDLSQDYIVCVAVIQFGGIRMLDNIVLKK